MDVPPPFTDVREFPQGDVPDCEPAIAAEVDEGIGTTVVPLEVYPPPPFIETILKPPAPTAPPTILVVVW